MLIGFDGSRAFVSERTGTENYSYNVLYELLQIDKKNAYKIYLRIPRGLQRSSAAVKEWVARIQDSLPKSQNFRLVVIRNERFWTQWGLARELLTRPVDVLFVPAHTLPYFRPSKIKTVVTIHDLGYEYLPEYHQFPQRLWLNRSTEYAAAHATQLIAVSEATKDDLISKLKTDAKKISVVYEGFAESKISKLLDPKILSQVAMKYGLAKNYLFYVGTIQPRKNLVRVIQAFAALLKREDVLQALPDLQLVLAGKKGWLFEEILAEPKRSGVEEHVKFLGHISDEDMYPLLTQSKGLVYPSLFEGFGLPILEAQACNVPVLTSNKKPMTEVAGKAAIFVNEMDVSSITDGMQRMLSDAQLVKRLKQDGAENCHKFSWRKAATETLAVLEKAYATS